MEEWKVIAISVSASVGLVIFVLSILYCCRRKIRSQCAAKRRGSQVDVEAQRNAKEDTTTAPEPGAHVNIGASFGSLRGSASQPKDADLAIQNVLFVNERQETLNEWHRQRQLKLEQQERELKRQQEARARQQKLQRQQQQRMQELQTKQQQEQQQQLEAHKIRQKNRLIDMLNKNGDHQQREKNRKNFLSIIDLHSFTLKVAMDVFKLFLEVAENEHKDSVLVITGWGKHSEKGPVIKPAVEGYLSKYDSKYKCKWTTKGSVRIYLTSN